jgi:hypothetical protein
MPVQWSRDDHPEHIPDGYYAMVVNPLIQGYEFSKCLMDGRSSLNIMYVETLTKLGLTKIQLRHSAVTFYGVVPGRQAKSLRSITLIRPYCITILYHNLLLFIDIFHI